MRLLWWLSLAALAYIYVGYAAVIYVLVRLRGARPVERDDTLRRVSLVISAYNEAGVIRQKLENALRLDYPRELLDIAVVSDASTDGTDAIVREFAAQGVTLHAQPARRGKTAGLNRTVPHLQGEIVVFSDANAIYDRSALRKLVRNFADPAVGCVTGEARYVAGVRTAAEIGERMYWSYEIQLKRLETAVGSMVGGDGAIYGIRKELWRELPETAINDFLNPLQIVVDGWRAVYEPEAVCYEEAAGGIAREYRRRVRIIGRSWRAIFQASHVLNPLRVGFFTVSVISHKILRWLSALFLAVVLAGGVMMLPPVVFAVESLGVAALTAGTALLMRPVRQPALLAVYFCVMNIASLVGVAKGTLGRVSATWSTPREAARPMTGGRGRPLGLGFVLCAGAGAVMAAGLVRSQDVTVVVFRTAVVLLAYVYVGYPLVLACLRRIVPRPVPKRPVEPTVCLFVTANDEEAVIGSKLRNSLSLDYPRHLLDIVVASDGSVDGTNDIVRSFAASGVRLLEYPKRRGKMAAINAGIPAIEADVIVFSDANTSLERGAIRALVCNLADPAVGVVSGDVVLLGDRAALAASEDLYYRYERWLQRAESDVGSMIGADGALYAVRRRLFVPSPDDTILDDLAIPMAAVYAGHRAVFEPGARAFEQGSRSAREELSRKTRIAAGAMQFLTRSTSFTSIPSAQVFFSLISHKVLRWVSPAFVLAAFGATVAMAGSGSGAFYTLAAVVQTAFIAVGLAGCVPAVRRLKPVGIVHYVCLMHAAAVVGLLRGALRRQPVAWQRFPRIPLDHRVAVGPPAESVIDRSIRRPVEGQ